MNPQTADAKKGSWLQKFSAAMVTLAMAAVIFPAEASVAVVANHLTDVPGYSDYLGYWWDSDHDEYDSRTDLISDWDENHTVTITADSYIEDGGYIPLGTTTTFRLTNKKSIPIVVTITTGGGVSPAYEAEEIQFTAGETKEFTVTTGEDDWGDAVANSGTLQITSCEDDIALYQTIFGTATNGSYTVTHADHGSITPDGSTAYPSDVTKPYTLVPSPAEGFVFGGWMSSTGKLDLEQNADGSYTYYGTKNDTIRPLFSKENAARYYLASDPNTFYNYWDEAVAAATAATSNQGKIIVLCTGGEIVNSPEAAQPDTFILPAGITFLAPYSDDDLTWSTGNGSSTLTYANYTKASGNVRTDLNPATECRLTLTIPEGATLVNNGVFLIGGTIAAGNNGSSGGCYGPHCNLELNGKLQMGDSSVLSAVGYIIGSGGIETIGTKAKIYQPFVICDYRDGSTTVASAGGSGKGIVPKSGEGKMLPFLRYTMQNIQTDMTIVQGNYMYGYCSLYASSEHQVTRTAVVGDSSMDALIKLKSNAVLHTSYNCSVFVDKIQNGNSPQFSTKTIGKTTLTITGGAAYGNMSLTVRLSLVSQTVSMSELTFAVPYNYDVVLEDGVYDIPNSISLLPGATMVVGSGATLNLGDGSGSGDMRFSVYDGLYHNVRGYTSQIALVYDGRAGTYTPNGEGYNSSRTGNLRYPTTAELQHANFGGNGSANFIVNGTLNIGSDVAFGGLVQTDGSGTVITNGDAKMQCTTQIGVAGYNNYVGMAEIYLAGATLHTLKAEIYDASTGERIQMQEGTTYRGVNNAVHTVESYAPFLYYYGSGEKADTSWGTGSSHAVNFVNVGGFEGASGYGTEKASLDAEPLNAKVKGTWVAKVNADTLVNLYLSDGSRAVTDSVQALITAADLASGRYYTDAACQAAATSVAAGDTLYAKAEARKDRMNSDMTSYYRLIEEAVALARDYGDAIVLLENAQVERALEVDSRQDFTLDLNGHTLSCATDAVLINYGTLELTSSASTKGTLESAYTVTSPQNMHYYATVFHNHGTASLNNVIILQDGTTKTYRNGINNRDTGTITSIDDVDVLVPEATSGSYGIYNYGKIGTIGNFSVDGYYGICQYGAPATIGVIGTQDSKVTFNCTSAAIYAYTNSTIDLIGDTGSTIEVTKASTGIQSVGGTINEIGRTGSSIHITATGTGIYAASNGDIGTIAPTSLTITGTQNGIYAASGGSIGTIAPASLTITGAQNGIYATGSGSTITNVGGSTVNITASQNGIYAASSGKIETIGAAGSIIITGAPNGIHATGSGSTIGTIGTQDSTIGITAVQYGIQATAGGYIGTVGGEGSTLTVTTTAARTGNNPYCSVYANGAGSKINVIGAKGSILTLGDTSRYATVGAFSGGTIGTIGGEGSTVNIDAASFGIYASGGVINTVGYKGEVNVEITNKSGANAIYAAGTNGKIDVIGGEGSTINIVGSNMAIDAYGSTASIRLIGDKKSHIIITGANDGICAGGGGEITSIGEDESVIDITVANRGLFARSASSMGTIGLSGSQININAKGQGITVNASAITTVGGEGSTIDITGEGSYGIYVHSAGSIVTVGQDNSTLTITDAATAGIYVDDANSTITTVGDVNSTIDISTKNDGIFLNDGAFIDRIGETGSQITIDANRYGIFLNSDVVTRINVLGAGGDLHIRGKSIGICLNLENNQIGTIGTEGGSVTVITDGPRAIYAGTGAFVEELGDALTAVCLTSGSYSTIHSAVNLISGGYYYHPEKTPGKAIQNYATKTYAKGHRLSTDTKEVTVDGTPYACYYVYVSDPVVGTVKGEDTIEEYATLADAIEGYLALEDKTNVYIVLYEDFDETEGIALEDDIYLDLNGHTVTLAVGGLAIGEGVTLYGMDSATNAYLKDGSTPGQIVGTIYGAVEPVYSIEDGANAGRHYATVTKTVDGKDVTQFHRAAISVTGMQFAFDPSAAENEPKAYLTFQGTFRGSTEAAGMLTDMGFKLTGTNVAGEEGSITADTWYAELVQGTAIDQMQFYYTEDLSSVTDVKNIAALMKFGTGNTADSITRDVRAALTALKEQFDSADLAEEERTALNSFFSGLTGSTEGN